MKNGARSMKSRLSVQSSQSLVDHVSFVMCRVAAAAAAAAAAADDDDDVAAVA